MAFSNSCPIRSAWLCGNIGWSGNGRSSGAARHPFAPKATRRLLRFECVPAATTRHVFRFSIGLWARAPLFRTAQNRICPPALATEPGKGIGEECKPAV